MGNVEKIIRLDCPQGEVQKGGITEDKNGDLLFWVTGVDKTKTPNRLGFLFDWKKVTDVQVENLRANPVVLYGHDTDIIVGRIEQIKINLKSVKMQLRIPNYPELEYMRRQIKDGYLKAVSIGFYIREYEELESQENDRYESRRLRVLAFEIVEISICSIGAHPTAVIEQAKGLLQERMIVPHEFDWQDVAEGELVTMSIMTPHELQSTAETQSLTHNSTLAEDEPKWSDVDKTKLPRNAYAEMGEPDKKSTWSYPHHWVEGGKVGDDGIYVSGTMYLHAGGLNAAWAAAQGARSGKKAAPEIISHLEAHRKVIEKTQETETYNCECLDCGHTMESEEHCRNIKCPKCGGEMRRVERPGPGQSIDTEPLLSDRAVDMLLEMGKTDSAPSTERVQRLLEKHWREELAKSLGAREAALDVNLWRKAREKLTEMKTQTPIPEWREKDPYTNEQLLALHRAGQICIPGAEVTLSLDQRVEQIQDKVDSLSRSFDKMCKALISSQSISESAVGNDGAAHETGSAEKFSEESIRRMVREVLMTPELSKVREKIVTGLVKSVAAETKARSKNHG